MSLRSGLFRVSFSLLLVLSLSLLTFADTIRLRDGSIIKGRIVSFAGGKFTIAIGEGSRLKQLTFMASEVESIVFDSPTEKPQLSSTTRPTTGGATIVNTSSTTTTNPPRVIVTDNVRTNGTATIASNTPSRPNNNTPKTTTVSNTTTPSANSNSGGAVQPIAWNIKVLADNTSNGWTNSGWVVKKGQRIRVSGDGQVSLGKGKTSPPSGLGDLQDDMKLLKNVPTGALIAVIGDDNNDFIYIGAEREFTATRDGALFLGINEGNLDDNSGAFNVKVEILPDQSN